MAMIVDSALAGFTIEYNGVQLGGSDATYESYPPMYSFSCQAVKDSSNRVVKYLRCRLRVKCVFTAPNEATMANNMEAVRVAFSQDARALKIAGLGSGFRNILNTGVPNTYVDVMNGPMVEDLELNAVGGQLAWELSCDIVFTVPPCTGKAWDDLAFAEFNFMTTWVNDFEGLGQRTISGHYSIPQVRDVATGHVSVHVADEKRDNLVISVPPNYKRVTSQFTESEDHSSMMFIIVDEQLKGDPLPDGITLGSANLTFSSGGENNANMSRSIVTYDMVLKTAPNQHRNLAGQIFLLTALSKQSSLSASAGTAASITVIPLHLVISNSKFEDCRITRGSMSWVITKDLASCLAAAKIWDPVSANLTAMDGTRDYTSWRTSMANLWGNRGTSGLISNVSDANAVNVCENELEITIGTQGSPSQSVTEASLPSLTCPGVPENGGWLHFDLDIKILRQENSHDHRRAASYVPAIGETAYKYDQQPGADATDINIGGGIVSQSSDQENITEYNGFPEFFIGLTFSGLRFVHKPFVPEIASVSGMAVRPKEQSPCTPKHAMDAFGCPVWSVSGYRVYSVPGYINSVKPVSSLTAADTSIPLDL